MPRVRVTDSVFLKKTNEIRHAFLFGEASFKKCNDQPFVNGLLAF